MKRTVLSMVVAFIAAVWFPLTAVAAPTGIYHYYALLETHGLQVHVDSSWEDMALNGSVVFTADEGNADAGSITFSYVNNGENTPLFAYAVRRANVQYTPGGARTPDWSRAEGAWMIEFYRYASISGEPYDAVLESVVAPEQCVMFSNPDEKWNFSCTRANGEAVSAQDLFLGKVTMVNAWATYCSPCLEEMPYLGELAKEYAEKGLRIVGVVTDVNEGADAEYAKTLILKTGADYDHVLNNTSLYSSLLSGVQYVPTTFFLNEQGVEIGRYVGGMDKAGWADIIEKMLAQ